jgi:hypothetical protein
LSPLALAVWYMDNGNYQGGGAKLATNYFTYNECLYLKLLLEDLYNLKVSVNKAGNPDQFYLYIWKESMPTLRDIIYPYLVNSMLYKIRFNPLK